MKQFYLLTAATVIFHTTTGEVGTVDVNVLTKGDTPDVNMMAIQRMNQGAAMMTQNMVGEDLTIDHIVITNIMHLGSFTEEEFQEGLPPEVKTAMNADREESDAAAALKERIETEAAASTKDDDFSNIKL